MKVSRFRKLMTVVLALAMTFALCACGDDDNEENLETSAADSSNYVDDTNVDKMLSDITETLTEEPEAAEEKPDPTDMSTIWGVWKGTVTYTDSWGKGMFDTSQDCTAIIDYQKDTGRPFFQLYLDNHTDYVFIHTWIIGSEEENSLNTFTFTPDIGDEDCWVGNRYMVHDDGWYFSGVNVDGKMNFEYDFTSADDDYGCHMSINLEKDPELSRQDSNDEQGASASSESSSGSSGSAKMYAGWYKAEVPAG